MAVHVIKYCLHPGWVQSDDGDWHYITATQLAFLYKLPMSDWVDVKYGVGYDHQLIHLYPDDDGNYEI